MKKMCVRLQVLLNKEAAPNLLKLPLEISRIFKIGLLTKTLRHKVVVLYVFVSLCLCVFVKIIYLSRHRSAHSIGPWYGHRYRCWLWYRQTIGFLKFGLIGVMVDSPAAAGIRLHGAFIPLVLLFISILCICRWCKRGK
jgi:hypothetical protein